MSKFEVVLCTVLFVSAAQALTRDTELRASASKVKEDIMINILSIGNFMESPPGYPDEIVNDIFTEITAFVRMTWKNSLTQTQKVMDEKSNFRDTTRMMRCTELTEKLLNDTASYIDNTSAYGIDKLKNCIESVQNIATIVSNSIRLFDEIGKDVTKCNDKKCLKTAEDKLFLEKFLAHEKLNEAKSKQHSFPEFQKKFDYYKDTNAKDYQSTLLKITQVCFK